MEDIEELRKTDEWELYEKSVQFMSNFNMYDDSNKNYRFYNGDQWYGLNVKGIEKVQLNFIKPIVDYKTTVINQNLWAIVYSSENYDNEEFKPMADTLCDLLNKRADKIWERTKMDKNIRLETLDSAINDEGINYTWWNKNDKQIENEIINKTDIYYGDETSSDIQTQPYIIIRKRLPVVTVREIADGLGLSSEKISLIVGDADNVNNIGDNNQLEKDDSTCTIITKLWRDGGTIHYSKATKFVQLEKDTDSGLTKYPVAHFLWTEKKGTSRGEGVVRNLIDNQIEVNKTLMRRSVVVKNTAYTQKIVNLDYVDNPSEVDTVGAMIKVHGTTNVNEAFANTVPAQMSTDVEKLQNDLIEITRTLENASDVASGSSGINDQTSGKAILAIQNASQQTLNSQQGALKDFIEQIAIIWLDHIITYGEDLVLQDEQTDLVTGETTLVNVKIPNSALKSLRANVRIDVTPISSYDQYAQELSLENLLKNGYFKPENIDQLELYVEALPTRSAMPKEKLKEIIEKVKAKQDYINQLNAQTQLMYDQANQLINNTTAQLEQPLTEEEIRADAQRQAREDFLAEQNA
jgi:hypothetical protein